MYTIRATTDTLLKPWLKQSTDIDRTSIVPIKKFVEIEIIDFQSISDHYFIHTKDTFVSNTRWFVYADHIEIIKGSEIIVPQIDTLPKETIIKVPYKSQLDNNYNPYGSCNVTSVAMCLAYYGISSKDPQVQLEDELYEYMTNHNLSRHSPHDLQYVAEKYGVKDNFRSDATVKDIQTHISTKKAPCIIHGYFTKFGHIVVASGYTNKGLVINDPYGVWYASGYDTSEQGKEVTYSYDLINRLCSPEGEGNIWCHFISK